MSSATKPHHSQVGQTEPLAAKNSALAHGLGALGLESAFKVLWGFYTFFVWIPWDWPSRWQPSLT
jgi:hypothetical protein